MRDRGTDACYRALPETRLVAALFGHSDNWLLTAVLAGVAGKVAGVALILLLDELAWQLFDVELMANFSGSRYSLNIFIVFLAVMLAPILESAIVLFIVWLLSKKVKASSVTTAVMCGAIFVPLHGISVMSLWVFPMFALHALIQLNWMGRGKTLGGYSVIVVAHAITNAIAVAFKAARTAELFFLAQ
jgi:hypothetical protein